jgi:hypothetical protein
MALNLQCNKWLSAVDTLCLEYRNDIMFGKRNNLLFCKVFDSEQISLDSNWEFAIQERKIMRVLVD